MRAPFFYTVGNHDVNVNLPPSQPNSHELSLAAWRRHFGEWTYCIVYKNCLFLVLDTMDGRKEFKEKKDGISPEQALEMDIPADPAAVRTAPTGTK